MLYEWLIGVQKIENEHVNEQKGFQVFTQTEIISIPEETSSLINASDAFFKLT